MRETLTACLISLAVIGLIACSSDQSESKSTATNQPKVTETAPPVAQTSGITIGAFIRGSAPDQGAAKAFEQGMELAADKSKLTATRTFLERAQGAATDPSFKKLVSNGSTPLVVYWQTADLAPAASVLKESNVIGVPVWNVTKKVAAMGTNVFGFGYSTERSFANFAKVAGTTLKSYRFAVISSSAEPFATQSKAFIEETKSQGNTVVFDEKMDAAGTSFSDLVARAKTEKCDTIFAVIPGNELVSLIKEARAGSFAGKILVGDSFFADELTALGSEANGIYILQAWNDDAAFKTQYISKFGGEPDGIILGAAALGYDLVRCLEDAGEAPDSGAISYSWLSKPCEGLTGKTQFSGERIAQRQKRILTVKNGKFELVS